MNRSAPDESDSLLFTPGMPDVAWKFFTVLALAACGTACSSATDFPPELILKGMQEAVFSRDGEQIYITKADNTGQHLWRHDIDSESNYLLTEGKRRDFSLDVSNNGKRLIFSSKLPGQPITTHMMDMLTLSVEVLRESENDEIHPRFSPDDTKIVYSSLASDGSGDLYVYDLEKKSAVRITEGKDHDTSPRFLPDGETILFWQAEYFGRSSPVGTLQWHRWDLYTLKPGDETNRITNSHFYRHEGVVVNPNGLDLMCELDLSSGPNLINIPLRPPYRIKGAAPMLNLYKPARSDGDSALFFRAPIYSKDSKHLYYTAAFDGHISSSRRPSEIYMFDFDTEETVQLTDVSKRIMGFDVSSDEGKIVYWVHPRLGISNRSIPYEFYLLELKTLETTRIM